MVVRTGNAPGIGWVGPGMLLNPSPTSLWCLRRPPTENDPAPTLAPPPPSHANHVFRRCQCALEGRASPGVCVCVCVCSQALVTGCCEHSIGAPGLGGALGNYRYTGTQSMSIEQP